MVEKIIHKFKSNNFTERDSDIRFIVIHTTDLNFAESLDILCDDKRTNRVSAHYLIDRNGDIYNLVDEEKTAWHAGVSYWKGIENINSFSIGIEIVCEMDDDITDQQYQSLIPLCKDIIKRHNINDKDNIVGHSDIAIGRKVDPGKRFNWALLEENGIGKLHSLSLDDEYSNKEEIKSKLERIGYDVKGHNLTDVLKAFALHHDLRS